MEAYESVHFLSSIFQGNASFTKSYRTILLFVSKRNDNEYLKLSFFPLECQKDFKTHQRKRSFPPRDLKQYCELLNWLYFSVPKDSLPQRCTMTNCYYILFRIADYFLATATAPGRVMSRPFFLAHLSRFIVVYNAALFLSN